MYPNRDLVQQKSPCLLPPVPYWANVISDRKTITGNSHLKSPLKKALLAPRTILWQGMERPWQCRVKSKKEPPCHASYNYGLWRFNRDVRVHMNVPTWQAKPSPSSSLWCMSKETLLPCCSLVILVTISRVPSSDTSFFSRSFWTATNLCSVSSFTQADGLYLWNPQSSSESSSFLGAFQVRGGALVAWKVNTTSKNRCEHWTRKGNSRFTNNRRCVKNVSFHFFLIQITRIKITSEMWRGSSDLFSRKMLTWPLLPTVPLGYTYLFLGSSGVTDIPTIIGVYLERGTLSTQQELVTDYFFSNLLQ